MQGVPVFRPVGASDGARLIRPRDANDPVRRLRRRGRSAHIPRFDRAARAWRLHAPQAYLEDRRDRQDQPEWQQSRRSRQSVSKKLSHAIQLQPARRRRLPLRHLLARSAPHPVGTPALPPQRRERSEGVSPPCAALHRRHILARDWHGARPLLLT